MDLESL